MLLRYEYDYGLLAAIRALRERCADLRTDSTLLCDYSKKLRHKSDRLLTDGAHRPGNAATIAA